MKTINPNIDIFNDYVKAAQAFEKSKVPCQLLEAEFGKLKNYFIDRSKQALKDWPNHYKLISEK
jgi:hypothetical protein